MKILTTGIKSHTNGVRGEPFYAVYLEHEHERLVATVTSQSGGVHIINPTNTAKMYRGDIFESDIRYAIVYWYSLNHNMSIERAKAELNDGLGVEVY